MRPVLQSRLVGCQSSCSCMIGQKILSYSLAEEHRQEEQPCPRNIKSELDTNVCDEGQLPTPPNEAGKNSSLGMVFKQDSNLNLSVVYYFEAFILRSACSVSEV